MSSPPFPARKDSGAIRAPMLGRRRIKEEGTMITLASVSDGKDTPVSKCPVVRGSQGVVSITPDLAAQIAGAALDDIEWITLLTGERSKDGYEVRVDGFSIPEQFRGKAHADIPEDYPAQDDVIGVMHLHPWWSKASFSSIDDSTLNPRFPFSIVVSPARNNLGFSYEARGKVELPCGAIGEQVDFKLQIAGVERFAQAVVRGAHDGEVQNLGDCQRFTETATDEYTVVEAANCGLTTVADTPAIFGREGAEFLAEVVAKTRVSPVSQGKTTYYTKGDGKGGNSFSGSGARGHRGRRRGGKLGGSNGGLTRIYDDAEVNGDFDGKGTFVAGGMSGCDWCHLTGKLLRKDFVFDDWLCRFCWKEAQQIREDAARSDSEANLYVGEGDEEDARRTDGIIRGLLGPQKDEVKPRWKVS